MAASKTIGGINVTISATTEKFTKGILTCTRMVRQFTASLKSSIFSVKGFAAALTGGLTIAAFTKMTSSAFKQIDALGELSDKLGVTTERLGGLQLAALDAGVSNEMLEKSLTTLAVKTGLRADMAFFNLARSVQGAATQEERLALVSTTLGARSTSMVRMLSMTADEFKNLEQAAINTGYAMSRQSVMGVERAMAAFDKFKAATSGVLRQTAVDLAPWVEMAANKGFEFLATNGNGKGIGSTIANSIIEMTKIVADGIKNMVGGVLEFVADFRALLHGFRSSAAGKAAGMGYQVTHRRPEGHWQGTRWVLDPAKAGAPMVGSDGFAAGKAGVDAARKRADAWNSAPAWSTHLDKMAADLKKQAELQAKMTPAMQSNAVKSIGDFLLGKGRGALNNSRNFWGGALGPMGRGVMGGVNAVGGMFAGPGGAMQSNIRQGVNAYDPLSREGNSQRVRSLAQNGLQNIGKKQLEKQDKMEKHLAKIAANPPQRLHAANLAG